MPRVEPVGWGKADDALDETYAAIEASYGQLLEPITVMAHSRPLLDAYLSFEGRFALARGLDRKIRDLAILRTAALVGCPFCIDIGSAESSRSGVSAEQVTDVHRYESSDHFTPLERLVLAYADAMTRTPGDVTDDLTQDLEEQLGAPALVELTAAIAWENFRSRFNRALGMSSHGFSDGQACAMPAHEALQ